MNSFFTNQEETNKAAELARGNEKLEERRAQIAKQQAEKEQISQTRMEHQSITDLAATKLEDKLTTMMANFMAQMKPDFNPTTQHPPATTKT